LQIITKTIPITFAVRHGDLLPILIYNIQLHPFLLRLEDFFLGVCFPDFKGWVKACADDVVTFGEDDDDLIPKVS
jgi:hypothetical protein